MKKKKKMKMNVTDRGLSLGHQNFFLTFKNFAGASNADIDEF